MADGRHFENSFSAFRHIRYSCNEFKVIQPNSVGVLDNGMQCATGVPVKNSPHHLHYVDVALHLPRVHLGPSLLVYCFAFCSPATIRDI